LPDHRFCPNCGSAVGSASDSVRGEHDDNQVTGSEPEPSLPDNDRPSWIDSNELSEGEEDDSSTLATREFQSQSFTPAPPDREPHVSLGAPLPQQASTYPPGVGTTPDPGHPTWGTPETTVQPEKGNRTLWIILGIVAFIVLICCCVLPLGLMVVSSLDTALQDELRVYSILTYA
jgi:hypothetical protein